MKIVFFIAFLAIASAFDNTTEITSSMEYIPNPPETSKPMPQASSDTSSSVQQTAVPEPSPTKFHSKAYVTSKVPMTTTTSKPTKAPSGSYQINISSSLFFGLLVAVMAKIVYM